MISALLLIITVATILVFGIDETNNSLTFDDEMGITKLFTSEIIASICNESVGCMNTINKAVRSVKVKIMYWQLLEFQRRRQYIGPHPDNNVPVTAYLDKMIVLQHTTDNANIDTICEVSDNTFGPSTINFLISNPKAKIILFHQFHDINTQASVSIVLDMFPDRVISIIPGNFTQTIVNFVQLFPLFRCNLIFIDTDDANYADYVKLLANNTFNRVIWNNMDSFNDEDAQVDGTQDRIKTIEFYNTFLTPCIAWHTNNYNGYLFNVSSLDDCNYIENVNVNNVGGTSTIVVGKYVANWSLMELIDDSRSDKNTLHSYIELYEALFGNTSRGAIKNVLEIGIKEGGSIILWHDYFFNATVYAIDLMDYNDVWHRIKNRKRVRLHASQDAYDETFVKSQLSNLKFDVIIDDGPHTLESMTRFIQLYSNILSENGILIVEDVQSIEWVDNLEQCVPEYLKKYIKVYDRRHLKDRYDDVVFTIDRMNSN